MIRIFLLISTLTWGTGLMVPPALAADGFQLRLLGESLDDSEFADRFRARRFSVGTSINNRDQMIGYQLADDGVFTSFNVRFGNSPSMIASERHDFLALAAAEPCSGWLCFVPQTFGILIDPEQGAYTGFLYSEPGATPAPGSLPFYDFPGEFVTSNAAGFIASTQVSAAGQFGLLITDQALISLPDVPWLVDINDNEVPQVLGYGGLLGDCLVYGLDCTIPPAELCGGENTHPRHRSPAGHRQHGNGHAYGQNPCHRPWLGIEYHGKYCDDDGNCALPASDDGQAVTDGELVAGNAALMIQPAGEGYQVWSFPEVLGGDHAGGRVSEVFPLAINNQSAVLRGNISSNGRIYWQRLLVCEFDPQQIDQDGDGIVDCAGGLRPLLPLEDGLRISTVLGFSLNNNGMLVGNYGFNVSGVGLPFRVHLNDPQPTAEPLANLARGGAGLEMNMVTDSNDHDRLIGYGYQQCGARLEAHFMVADELPAATGIGFATSWLLADTWLKPDEQITVMPEVVGGVGEPMWRFSIWEEARERWTPVRDWDSNGLTFSVAGERDLCVQVELADTANPDDRISHVIRYRVSEENPAGSWSPPSSTTGGLELNEEITDLTRQIGASAGLWLMLVMLAWRRRWGAA